MITSGSLKLSFFLSAVLCATGLLRAEDAALELSGEVKSPLKLTLAEIKAMPPATATVTDSDGSTAKFEGVPLHAILERGGVPQGESLRGAALQLCVVVKAADSYKVVFALAELDPLVTDKQVLLAYSREGKELDSRTGPLRVIIPDEKRHGRWVRQVTALEVLRAGSAAGHGPSAGAQDSRKEDASTH